MPTLDEYIMELLQALDEKEAIAGEYYLRDRKISQLMVVIKKLMSGEKIKEDEQGENKA